MTYEMLMADLVALASVVVVDLVLAGDNAVIIGMAAGRLEQRLRARAIAVGIALAVVFRVIFAVFAVSLLMLKGLLLVGGLLLLWVAWRMWNDMQSASPGDVAGGLSGLGVQTVAVAGLWTAIRQIAVADMSMSLDNVLAVAGIGRHNMAIMAGGLLLSIVLMAAVAASIARLLDRHAWLGYLGLTIVLIVAVGMIYDGATDIAAIIPLRRS
jgi:YjbE family integral membrane protein